MERLPDETIGGINESIERLDAAQTAATETAASSIVTELFGVQYDLKTNKTELINTRNDISRNIVRGTDANSRQMDRLNSTTTLERAAANAYRAADSARIQGLRDSHAAANAHLAAIERKPTSFSTTVNLTTNTTVAFSTSAALVQLSRVTQSNFGNQQDFARSDVGR